MMVRGQLAPDSRLYQERLAEELGVSRTPVREALLRMEQEGILYSKPGGGMRIKAMSPRDVSELYETRVALEPFAAGLSCERATPKDVERIWALQRRHESRYPKDVGVAFRTNLELHTGLVQSCGNGLLLRFLESVWHRDTAFRIFAFYPRDVSSVHRMVAEHGRIVKAFALGDRDRVERLLRSHIQDSHRSLLERLDEMREEGEAP